MINENKTPVKMLEEWLKAKGFAGLTLSDCYCPIGNLVGCPIDSHNFFDCTPYRKGQEKGLLKHGMSPDGERPK
jgi:hypothetical protein